MPQSDALLRHRELTQEVYNIGDEVAEYIEHLAQAIADYDEELVVDCHAEFELIIDEARTDSRRTVAELIGLRQALTSGIRSGSVSVRGAVARSPEVERPELLDDTALTTVHPLSVAPVIVRELSDSLSARTRDVVTQLEAIVEWVLDQTAVAADDLDAVSLPLMFAHTRTLVDAAADGWLTTVARQHPAYCRTMRGSNPPTFLLERARVDAVVAKVARKLARNRGAHGGGFAS
ncbi:hypothetical protein M0E87_03535 [Corynebacterium sp. CCM 9185]|uniref:DUF222 domain-containing protein n=1 Tax=Corynebacterium marambiense TaxID=2765364 RepID=A0ABS0VW53_9CORY|nr:hypothetical protein [Corynebacterium marambiense]MBI9000992.1 hypothetical protein [Corynebacterium marambiense]MCK7662737.1 hypothetical protein [Corynebacterium marambiense]MCX7543225.1 hypothetical protein [Corynebacterium marambiense]